MSSVSLPRGLLAALVVALLASLGITAFLAGRASVATAPPLPGSARPPSPEADGPPSASVPSAPAGSAPGATGLPRSPELELNGSQAWPPSSPPAGAAAPRALPELERAGGVPAPGEAARVARYFQEMESAQAAAKYWTDPQALATSLVDDVSKGERGGFDQLIAATRGALERMKALDVPAECAEHHRRSLALVEQSITMLSGVANGALGGDPDALGAFAIQGRRLEADAKDVDALAARIKQRYGLA
jgi:hypothetical protein